MSKTLRCQQYIVSGVAFMGMRVRLELSDQLNITSAAVSGLTVEVWDTKGRAYANISVENTALLLPEISKHVAQAREALKIAEAEGKTFIECLRDIRRSA